MRRIWKEKDKESNSKCKKNKDLFKNKEKSLNFKKESVEIKKKIFTNKYSLNKKQRLHHLNMNQTQPNPLIQINPHV